jgi:protein SCO1
MRSSLCLSLAIWVAVTASAFAQPNTSSPEATYSYDQRLGAQAPRDLLFQDEQGRDVHFGDFLGKRPIVLVMAQFRCPMLCNQVLNGLVDCLRGLPANAGEGFEVIVISFDKRERPELAAAKKAAYVADYGRPGAETGWHFLTGPQDSIDSVALAIGFQYAFSERQDRFAHPTGVVILTAEGKVSGYLYGILYPGDEMRVGLDKAAEGKIGSPVPTYRRVLLLCYDYDAATGGYSASVMKMVRTGAVLIVLILAVGLTIAWVRERRAVRRGTVRTAGGSLP